MSWLDGVLLQVLPVLILMSLVLVLAPSLRRKGSWRAIGAAWLAVFAISLLIFVTRPNDVELSCQWLRLVPTGVTSFTALNASEPCSASNSLAMWLVALPPLTGIAILLAWIWRNTRPAVAALRTIGAVTAISVVSIALGQVSEGLALLFVAAVVAAAYAWPRLQRRPTGLSAGPP